MKHKKGLYSIILLLMFFYIGILYSTAFAQWTVKREDEVIRKEPPLEKPLPQEGRFTDREFPPVKEPVPPEVFQPGRVYTPQPRTPEGPDIAVPQIQKTIPQESPTPRRVSVPEAKPPQQKIPLTTEPAIKEGKISLDIKGMDIIDVLKLLSQQAGLNIVAGKNVRGRVTLFLRDVDPWDAFEIILAANDLAYEKKGDIITVMSERDYELLYGDKFNIRQRVKIIKLRYAKAVEVSKALNQIKTKVGKIVVDEASNIIIIKDAPEAMTEMVDAIRELDIPTETKIYSLNYATAEKIKEKLSKVLSKAGLAEIDERTNKLIVTDLPEKIREIDTLITELDEKTKQVLIDAKIIQIDLNDEYQLGVNWDAFFDGINMQLGSNFQAITSSLIPSSSTASGFAFTSGQLDGNSYQLTVKALETLGKTNILSSPRIVTANNQEAKILVGTNQPYATSTTTTPSTGSSIRSYQITYLDLGVKLYVTPTINKDGFITMKIKPEVSSRTSEYEYGEYDDKVPVVKTSQAETTVVVKDGTTIVIAGLMETRDEEEVDKMPLLGDIPILGNFFKSTSRGSSTNPEKTELVIFITPRIITGDVSSPEKEIYKNFIYDLETSLEDKEFFKIKSKQVRPALEREIVSVPKEVVTEGEEVLSEEVIAEETETTETIQEYQEVAKVEPPIQKGNAIRKIGEFTFFKEAVTEHAIPEKQLVEEEDIETSKGYKEFVRRRVHELINQRLTPLLKGDVHVEFSISKDGTLEEEPRVLEFTNEDLKHVVVESVKDASPFPSFSEGAMLDKRTFKIFISTQ